jgi:hypothetical protein
MGKPCIVREEEKFGETEPKEEERERERETLQKGGKKSQEIKWCPQQDTKNQAKFRRHSQR